MPLTVSMAAAGFSLIPAWLHLVYIGLLVLVVFLLWANRTRVLLERTKHLEDTLNSRTTELRTAMERLEHQALHDDLTGLPNHRSFWEQARRMRAAASRSKSAFGLIVLDLDDFKEVNDGWGHQIGNEALVFTADRLREVVREADLVARYGGEEFVVLLADSHNELPLAAAERIREHLKARPYFANGETAITLTGSLGVSTWRGGEDTLEDLFQRADSALYSAKASKDCVAVSDDDIHRILEPQAN